MKILSCLLVLCALALFADQSQAQVRVRVGGVGGFRGGVRGGFFAPAVRSPFFRAAAFRAPAVVAPAFSAGYAAPVAFAAPAYSAPLAVQAPAVYAAPSLAVEAAGYGCQAAPVAIRVRPVLGVRGY